jgi:hypothetical protein
MATRTRTQPRIAGSITNAGCHPYFFGGPESTNFIEAAAQTWGMGDFLYLDSSGNLAICTSSGALLNVGIAGLAFAPASGVTGAKVHFAGLRSTDILEMNVYHATPASAVLARTLLGKTYAIELVSGIWCVSLANGGTTAEDGTHSTASVKIIEYAENNVDGDVYGRVKCLLVPFSIETDGGGLRRVPQLLN